MNMTIYVCSNNFDQIISRGLGAEEKNITGREWAKGKTVGEGDTPDKGEALGALSDILPHLFSLSA